MLQMPPPVWPWWQQRGSPRWDETIRVWVSTLVLRPRGPQLSSYFTAGACISPSSQRSSGLFFCFSSFGLNEHSLLTEGPHCTCTLAYGHGALTFCAAGCQSTAFQPGCDAKPWEGFFHTQSKKHPTPGFSIVLRKPRHLSADGPSWSIQ